MCLTGHVSLSSTHSVHISLHLLLRILDLSVTKKISKPGISLSISTSREEQLRSSHSDFICRYQEHPRLTLNHLHQSIYIYKYIFKQNIYNTCLIYR